MKILQCRSTAIVILLVLLPFTTEPATAEVADPHPKLSLSLSLGKTEAYPGEAVPVTVTLRINDATVRNIGYPRLDAPNGKAIVFAPPVQEFEAGDPGIILHRFTGQISGVTSGKRIIGPARLDCEVMKSAGGSAAFFGGQEPEPVQLTSAAASVAVLPLPAVGKLDTFSGAVGTFSLTVKALPAQIAIGEPLTVTTTIRGDGSLADAACPSITGPKLQSFPVQATRSASQIVCEQVVLPTQEVPFPPVIWSYFDPEKQDYRTLSVEISSRVITHQPNLQPASPPPSPVSVTPSQKPIAYSSRLLVILAAIFVLIQLLVVIVRKRNKPALVTALQDNPGDLKKMLLAAEQAALQKDFELFYDEAFAVIQLVGKLYSTIRCSGTMQHFDNALDSDTIHPEQRLINEIRCLTSACDKVRYGRIMPDATVLMTDLKRLQQLRNYL